MLLNTRTSRKTESRRILAVHPVLRALLLSLALWSCTQTTAAPISRDDPESTDPGRKAISNARGSAVVVTANPLGSTAALAALNDGGSGTALLQKTDRGWQGAADPRREGTALAMP